MIPAELIDQARRTDILDTARRYVTLKRITAIEYSGPCPVCGGTDRFAINTRKQIWSCRYCRGDKGKGKGGGVIDLVQHAEGVTFVEAVERLAGKEWAAPKTPRQADRKLDDEAERLKGIADAVSLWAASGDPRGTPAETYLRARDLDLDDEIAGAVLRWHGGLGAMIALFRNIETNKPQAVSRVFPDPQTGKATKRLFLGPVGGAAVMLDTREDVLGGLHVGEGIETALAARQLGLRPTWALGSAVAVAGFPVLSGVECLTLLQENDEASPRACEACAARWHAAGRAVILNKPTVGKDLNDALRAAGGAR